MSVQPEVIFVIRMLCVWIPLVHTLASVAPDLMEMEEAVQVSLRVVLSIRLLCFHQILSACSAFQSNSAKQNSLCEKPLI